jgi:hypothetical protein
MRDAERVGEFDRTLERDPEAGAAKGQPALSTGSDARRDSPSALIPTIPSLHLFMHALRNVLLEDLRLPFSTPATFKI